MRMDRVWAMPNARTFTIKPIARLLRKEFDGPYVDPFPYPYKRDALEFLRGLPDASVRRLAFDPPYSQRQLREMYDNAGMALNHKMDNSYWSHLRNEIERVMEPGGKVISFGWQSCGIGRTRGFEITRIMLVAHGSQHNDTICTVEVKTQSTLEDGTWA